MSFPGDDLNLKATELRLGLPGSEEPEKQAPSRSARSNKRASPEVSENSRTSNAKSSLLGPGTNCDRDDAPPNK